MPQDRATSSATPSVLERPPSRSTADHLPQRPSCSLIKKPPSRVEGNVVCKKRKWSTERREQKVSHDGDKMCLAQRLRHHHDALATDRHARYDLWRTSSHRKEQHRSDPSAPSKDTDRQSLHNANSCDRRVSRDKGKEEASALPSPNNGAPGGSGGAVCEKQCPASQLEIVNTVPSAESVDRFLDTIHLSSATLSSALVTDKSATPAPQTFPPTPVSIAPVPLPLPGSPAADPQSVPFTFGPERLSLLHQGHPLNYDLNLLPNDPIGPITLLGATQSEPGAYLVVGAHYRRTGRSRAACEVIKALLRRHAPATRIDALIGENKENGKGLALKLS
jgi:hypothetical protein